MTDEDALRAACDANPGYDTPLLVMADWLDDHDRAGEAAAIRRGVVAREKMRAAVASLAPSLAQISAAFAAAGKAMQPTADALVAALRRIGENSGVRAGE